MIQLVLLRHGESVWNQENRFTGWTDVDLTHKGLDEARHAGAVLKEKGFCFDMAFTSVLKRSIRTLWIVLDEMDMMWVPISNSWRLNERHYGALQGLNKSETAKQYGEEQVAVWRRSYAVRPPALTNDDSRYPSHDPRYKGLQESDIPLTESLKDTIERSLPYWHRTIKPFLLQKKRVLIVAHGNSLRALVKYIDKISDQEIAKLEIPTGVPLVYEMDDHLKALRRYYLSDRIGY